MSPAPQALIHREQALPGGTRIDLALPLGGGTVPAILQLPAAQAAPAALLLHGYSSRGEAMANSVGRVLLRRDVGSLALDLPLHGSRGNPLELQALRNPLEVTRLWRLALREAAQGVEFLRAHPAVRGQRVGVVGYSLGSFLAVMLAAQVQEVRAVVLAAGGDLPQGTPLTAAARTVADPLRAVRKLEGRPLLMVNGRHDPVIRPEQAERLFAAAREPRELRWWEGGHILPQAATEDAADWLAAHLHADSAHAGR